MMMHSMQSVRGDSLGSMYVSHGASSIKDITDTICHKSEICHMHVWQISDFMADLIMNVISLPNPVVLCHGKCYISSTEHEEAAVGSSLRNISVE